VFSEEEGGEGVTFIGVLQTGDIDEAIALAKRYVSEGKHILCDRVSFEMTPEFERDFMEQDPEGYYYAVREHEPIEYEVYVEIET
jgi:hypothetical protein